MSVISREEDLIIQDIFSSAASERDLEIIKRCVIDTKNHKGIYDEVIHNGPDLQNSKNCIIARTGLGDKICGNLAILLWFLVNPEIERNRRLNAGITEAIWVYEAFLCKHESHSRMGGEKYNLRKGFRIGIIKRIHPGQLVGCRCMSKIVIPILEK